jgi:flagellar assembly protein FliH
MKNSWSSMSTTFATARPAMQRGIFASDGRAVLVPLSVASFSYPDTCVSAASSQKETNQSEMKVTESAPQSPPGVSAREVEDLLSRARAEAITETEARLTKDFTARLETQEVKIKEALSLFQSERRSYFARAEADLVQLALAISAKILHREAQVDPLLVATLVRVAVEKLHDGSSVSVRVAPAEAEKWRTHLASPSNGSTITILEDGHLGPEDCILETDLGSANFSIEAQLKEVEQGFFDLLAQKPPAK